MNALRLGDRLVYDDSDCTVEAIGAGSIHIRSDAGSLYALTPAAALAALRSNTPPPEPHAPHAPLLDGLPDEIVTEAIERQDHVREVLTGYRSGDPQQALPDEPRPEYDLQQVLKLTDRQTAKAAELKCALRSVQRWCDDYRDFGLAGLVDKRRTALLNPVRNADERIIDAITYLAEQETYASTAKRQRFRRRLRRHLFESHGLSDAQLPSDRTLDRYIDHVIRGSYTFDKATTRRSAAMRRPKVLTGFHATRAGELVLVDGNRLDILAWDPETNKAIAVELLLALDSYTRSMIAWRFTPLSPDRCDMSMLLADMLNPLEMRPHWKQTVAFSAMAIPYNRLVELDERLALAAARPIIAPETLVLDNAKIFLSKAVSNACEQLGVSIDLARLQQGPDKAQVERAFLTIRTQFCEHVVGYKGNTVVHRGEDVEGQALWTIAELEELFSEYVVTIYNRRINRALVLPCAPAVRMSPREAYEESIARCGYLPAICNESLYFELLPTEWVTIQGDSLDVRGLSYSGKVLVGRRRELSPFSAQKGKWPVKYDSRDRLHVYFQDRDGSWHTLRWIHAWEGIEPFTERMIDSARRLQRSIDGRRATQEEVAEMLKRLQNFTDIPPEMAGKLRRRLSRDVERGRQVEIDRSRAGAALTTLKPVVPPSPLTIDEDFDLDDLDDLPVFGTSS